MFEKIGDALARTGEMNAIAVDDHLADARTRVVIGAHREPVCARRAHGEEIAGLDDELAVVCEEIAALAHGSYDLPAACLAAADPPDDPPGL